MSDFSKEDYLAGADEADDLAGQGKADQPSPAKEPDQGPAEGQESQTDQPADASTADASAESETPDSSRDSSPAPADGTDDALTPLGKAKKEAADYLEALQRERAEFINYRNRAQKEQERFRQHGIIDVLTALLPALDDIDRIQTHGNPDESFTAVAAKIDKIFAKFGVEKYGQVGEDFDPARYDAVLRKPDSTVDHEVIDTLVEAGYKIGDRVVRAARVVVAVPSEAEEAKDKTAD